MFRARMNYAGTAADEYRAKIGPAAADWADTSARPYIPPAKQPHGDQADHPRFCEPANSKLSAVVQHEQYGLGKVEEANGYGAFRKVRVRFRVAGKFSSQERQLNLKWSEGKHGGLAMRFALPCVIAAVCVVVELLHPARIQPPQSEETPVAAIMDAPEPLNIVVPQDEDNLREREHCRKSNEPLDRDLANGRFTGGKLARLDRRVSARSPSDAR